MNSNARATFAPDPQSADAWGVAPLPAALAGEARNLVAKLDARQRLWLAGYLAGSVHAADPAAAASSPAGPGVTVLFGSHTGNSERLARQIAERLAARGLRYTLIDMLECRKTHLQEAHTLLLVVSTHGNGDPPERAVPLLELLSGRKAPRLEQVQYAVLALGDSSYEKFCEAGRQFDARLEALGAARLHARGECDVDFESAAARWIDGVVQRIEPDAAQDAPIEGGAERRSASISNAYTRKNPLLAPVLANLRLTAAGSTKDVRHIELAIEDAGIHYEPGDALGIVAQNRAADVDELLARLPFDGRTPVAIDAQGAMPLRQALAQRVEIGPINSSFLERYAAATQSAALLARVEGDAGELAAYVRARHLLDVVAEHRADALDADAFVKLLRPLAPRLYSIASSQRATPDEVHLTVGVVDYTALGRARRGLVSGLLADASAEDASLPVYLHRNAGLRLPADPAAAIVMIGAGTGIAPYRAFLAERAAVGAKGRNWLIFGDRSFETDFLYQAEWLDWRKRGPLSRIDVAFSRDQAAKVYVQQRMLERGADLWRWLEDGAHVYVCGDAERMAPDVQRALVDIIERHGGRSADDAEDYLLALTRQRRYQRDVY